LDFKNNVWAWGSGQQNQLGRRVVERTRTQGLTPREFGLPRGKIVDIACGGYHSFAIHQNGKVFAWGLNNFGETGITDGAGEDGAVIPQPTIVTSLEGYEIKHIDGGGHHSLACTADGKVLAFGRSDGFQLGIDLEDVPKENFVYDERENPRFVKKPVELPGKIHSTLVHSWMLLV
jgi:regulator of chromosome condensation